MVHIETYEPKYKNDFIRLNKEWIESYFKIESSCSRGSPAPRVR